MVTVIKFFLCIFIFSGIGCAGNTNTPTQQKVKGKVISLNICKYENNSYYHGMEIDAGTFVLGHIFCDGGQSHLFKIGSEVVVYYEIHEGDRVKITSIKRRWPGVD